MLDNKHVFWQALVVALIVFCSGIVVGVYFEGLRIDKIENFYFDSETDIFDSEISSEIIFDFGLDCKLFNEQSVLFADRIFEEARMLEKYDDSNRITKELISLHRRYDLLRVMLWKQIIYSKERCGGINTIVYIYQYIEPPVNTEAVQGAMSNHLLDLKGKYKDELILIPIAGDTAVRSLEILEDIYKIEDYPVIVVNEEHKIYNLDSMGEIEQHLNSIT